MLNLLKKIAKDIAHNPVGFFACIVMLVIPIVMEQMVFSHFKGVSFLVGSIINLFLAGIIVVNMLDNIFGCAIVTDLTDD